MLCSLCVCCALCVCVLCSLCVCCALCVCLCSLCAALCVFCAVLCALAVTRVCVQLLDSRELQTSVCSCLIFLRLKFTVKLSHKCRAACRHHNFIPKAARVRNTFTGLHQLRWFAAVVVFCNSVHLQSCGKACGCVRHCPPHSCKAGARCGQPVVDTTAHRQRTSNCGRATTGQDPYSPRTRHRFNLRVVTFVLRAPVSGFVKLDNVGGGICVSSFGLL